MRAMLALQVDPAAHCVTLTTGGGMGVYTQKVCMAQAERVPAPTHTLTVVLYVSHCSGSMAGAVTHTGCSTQAS
jgi:hypothetical protein